MEQQSWANTVLTVDQQPLWANLTCTLFDDGGSTSTQKPTYTQRIETEKTNKTLQPRQLDALQ